MNKEKQEEITFEELLKNRLAWLKKIEEQLNNQ